MSASPSRQSWSPIVVAHALVYGTFVVVLPVLSLYPDMVNSEYVSALNCDTSVPSGVVDVFRPSTCRGYTSCVATFCTCVGVASGVSSTVATCVSGASSALSSTTLSNCVDRHATCLVTLATAARNNDSDSCMNWATTSYLEILRSAAAAQFNATSVASSCAALACAAVNATSSPGRSVTASNFSAVTLAACYSRNVTRAYQLKGTLQMGGAQWLSTVRGAVGANMINALASDIASLFQVPNTRDVVIESLNASIRARAVSASATFVLYDGVSALSPGGIMSAAQAALRQPMGKWLATTLSQYPASDATLLTFGVSNGVDASPSVHRFYMSVSGQWSLYNSAAALYRARAGADASAAVDFALATDIASYLGTTAENIVIHGVSYCRLVVLFSVAASAGFDDASLTAKLVIAPTQSNWLKGTAAVYADVFQGTVGAANAVIPQTVTPVIDTFETAGMGYGVSDNDQSACTAQAVQLPPETTTTRPRPVLVDPGYGAGKPSTSNAIRPTMNIPIRSAFFIASIATLGAAV